MNTTKLLADTFVPMCVCAVFRQPKQTSLLNQNIAGPNLCQVDCDI